MASPVAAPRFGNPDVDDACLALTASSFGTPVFHDASSDNPSSPFTNLCVFMDYSDRNNSLSSLVLPGPVANYDLGGEETGVTEHWERKALEVKKCIDDVSGSEKLHASQDYSSKIINNTEEIRYIHTPLAQNLFDRVGRVAAIKK